jgi:hypothetical protein
MKIVILFCLIVAATLTGFSAEVVVDFEQAEIGKPATNWVEKGVIFTLAHTPKVSKAQGRIMFFPHLATNHKGILCAMATEPIAVQATLPKPASTVTLLLWGSTGCPALLEAFDKTGVLVDKVSLSSVPGRTKPEDPIPMFEMKVKAAEISFVRLSGPRAGEFLAADELRFTPVD